MKHGSELFLIPWPKGIHFILRKIAVIVYENNATFEDNILCELNSELKKNKKKTMLFKDSSRQKDVGGDNVYSTYSR